MLSHSARRGAMQGVFYSTILLFATVAEGGGGGGTVYLACDGSGTGSGSGSGGCKELVLDAEGFEYVDAKKCELSYGKYTLFTVDNIDQCQDAVGNGTEVAKRSTSKLPYGCGYFDHPLLNGAVVYFNDDATSSVECDPSIAMCVCRKERRSVEIGTNFLYLLCAFLGFIACVAFFTWFQCIRITKYERERIKHIQHKLAEQIGPGGAASTLALKPFGDSCVSLTWRFGTTEGDCIEDYKRQHREKNPGVIGIVTQGKPQWGTVKDDGNSYSAKSRPLAQRENTSADIENGPVSGGEAEGLNTTTSNKPGQYAQLGVDPEMDV